MTFTIHAEGVWALLLAGVWAWVILWALIQYARALHSLLEWWRGR